MPYYIILFKKILFNNNFLSTGIRYKNKKKKKDKKMKIYSVVWKHHKKGLTLFLLSVAMLLMSADKTNVMGPKMDFKSF